MEKPAGMNSLVVHHRNVSDRRSNARAKDSDARVTLPLEPAQTPLRILHRLPVCLQCQANV